MHARSEMRKAELLSTMGAGVLGAGLVLLLERWVGGAGVHLLVVGIVMHGVGMYRRRKLEAQSDPVRPVWEEFLYWGCWVLLAAIAAWIVLPIVSR